LIPPSYGEVNFRAYQNVVGRSIADAVDETGVKYVVNLSSVGADLKSGTGPVLGLHDQEERLNRLEKVNVLHLRPTFFMENFLPIIPVIESRGVFGYALRGDVRFTMIATRDIAEIATQRLLALDWEGKSVLTLLGERDLNLIEIAQALGKAIGKPTLQHRQVPYEEASLSMTRMGCSEDVARCMIEMLRGINEGRLLAGTPRTPQTTTRTSIEQFAVEFADAYATATQRAKAA
jgi:hypothetical protein